MFLYFRFVSFAFEFLATMSTKTAILHLGLLLFSLAFQESYMSAQDLKCFNDYDEEFVCYLTPEERCYEYRLDVTVHAKTYRSISVSPDTCEFKVNVPQSFVLREDITVELFRESTLLLSKKIPTEAIIKPKRPIIDSIFQTENGNFLITLNTSYPNSNQKVFFESLTTFLTYSIKGSEINETRNLGKERTSYEIVARNLNSNSVYVVTARVSTSYNNNSIFSDYAEPREFTTPLLLHDILKIVIPISCIIVIIFMVTIYCCYNKIRKEWWDKISAPVIHLGFEKKEKVAPFFSPYQNDFLSVDVETPKVDVFAKTWKPSPQVSRENSSLSLRENSDSAKVIYAETGYESVEGSSSENNSECQLLVARQLERPQLSSGKNLQRNKDLDILKLCGNTSGSSFSNKSYMASDSGGSSCKTESIGHLAYHTNESGNSEFDFSKVSNLPIQVDFEYGPCNGCSAPLNKQQQTHSEVVMVSDYQSVNEDTNQTHKTETHAFISHDINLGKTMYREDSPEVSWSACDILVDSGYQDFQSLDKSTGEFNPEMEENVSCDANCHIMNYGEQKVDTPALKSLCGPILHISPGIQIDCSYQRV